MNKENTPLISIIMPVYNAMPYLEMAIKSIFAQTYKNWELIIVDDASTDGSFEFLQEISDPRIRLFRNEKNMRNAYTCNKGILHAKGKYIAKMDADDISLPTRLEKQFCYMEANPHIDVIGCGSYKVDKDLNIISINKALVRHEDIIRLVSLDKNLIFGPNIHITDGALFGKREWFLKHRYNESFRYTPQDFDLVFRAQYDSVYGNVEEPLYIYRKVGVTSTFYSKIKSSINKGVVIFKYGFRKTNFFQSLIGIFTLIIHLAIAAITPFFIMLKTHLKKSKNKLFLDDRDFLEIVNNISKIKLPMRYML